MKPSLWTEQYYNSKQKTNPLFMSTVLKWLFMFSKCCNDSPHFLFFLFPLPHPTSSFLSVHLSFPLSLLFKTMLCWGRRYFNKSACFLFFFDPLSVCLLCYIKPASGMLSSPALSITAYNVSLCFDLCREKYCRGRPGAILTCFTFSLLTHRLNYEFTCHLLVWETCPKWQYHIYIKNLIWHE